MDDLREYLVVLPSTAAVINGLIAVSLANFFKEKLAARVILVVIAWLIGAAAVGSTFYGQHQIVAAREAAAQRNKEIRDALGSFIEEGQRIIAAGCADSTIMPPWTAIAAWQSKIIAFLNDRMGHHYVQRLTNLPPGFLTNTSCSGANPDFNKAVRIVIELNTHLEQFSQQSNF